MFINVIISSSSFIIIIIIIIIAVVVVVVVVVMVAVVSLFTDILYNTAAITSVVKLIVHGPDIFSPFCLSSFVVVVVVVVVSYYLAMNRHNIKHRLIEPYLVVVLVFSRVSVRE